MRGPLSLNDRPDDQAQRCPDDHAECNLGAFADQSSEHDAKRPAQCQTQSRCLDTSVRSASHLRSPVVATALLTGSPPLKGLPMSRAATFGAGEANLDPAALEQAMSDFQLPPNLRNMLGKQGK